MAQIMTTFQDLQQFREHFGFYEFIETEDYCASGFESAISEPIAISLAVQLFPEAPARHIFQISHAIEKAARCGVSNEYLVMDSEPELVYRFSISTKQLFNVYQQIAREGF